MTLDFFRQYCLQKAGVSEHLPFDISTLVFKVGSKMFALTDLDRFESVNLKCNPEKAQQYRETFEEIIPGFHMNKTHWNTVSVHGTLEDRFICELIDHSYELVLASLTRKERESLES